MNYNTILKTRCQFNPIVKLSKSISPKCTNKKSDDKSRDQPDTMVKRAKEDTNI